MVKPCANQPSNNGSVTRAARVGGDGHSVARAPDCSDLKTPAGWFDSTVLTATSGEPLINIEERPAIAPEPR